MSKRTRDAIIAPSKQAKQIPETVTLLGLVLSSIQKTCKVAGKVAANGQEGGGRSFEVKEAKIQVLNWEDLCEVFGGEPPTCKVFHMVNSVKQEHSTTTVPSEFKIKTPSLLEKGMVVLFSNISAFHTVGKKDGKSYYNFESASTVVIAVKGVPVRLPTDGEISFDLPVEGDQLRPECVDIKRVAVRIGQKWRVNIPYEANFDEVVTVKKEFKEETKPTATFNLVDNEDIDKATCSIHVSLAGCSALLCIPKNAENKVVPLGPANGPRLIPTWRRFLETVLRNPYGWVGVSGTFDKARTNDREMEDVFCSIKVPVIAWPRFWVGEAFSNFLVKAKMTKTMLDEISLPKFSLPPGLLPFNAGLRIIAFNEPEKTVPFLFQHMANMFWFVPVQDPAGWEDYPALMTELRAMEGEEGEMGKPGVDAKDVIKKIKEFGENITKGRSPYGTPILVLFKITNDPAQTEAVNTSWKKLKDRYYPGFPVRDNSEPSEEPEESDEE